MWYKLQNWIYKKGTYFWFDCPLTTKEAKRERMFDTDSWAICRGIRWKWLTKLVRFMTRRKVSYWKSFQDVSPEEKTLLL